MLGPLRHSLLMSLALGVVALSSTPTRAQPPSPKPASTDSGPKPTPADFALPGEDAPKAFVPARPRSVEEQKQVEALRYYAAARAYEERRQFGEAIRALEKALASNPESTPVLRRLSKINFALGREGPAVSFARRVLAINPGDTETVELLVKHYRNDPASAETLLRDILNNPKLNKSSVGALYAEFELGNLYEASLQFDLAAEAFAKVVEALDEKPNGRLSPSDLRRFLGNEESQAYLRFGRVFVQAKKLDLAIKAFQRGLVYEPDDASLLLFLAQTYLEAARPNEALDVVERFLKRQPGGRETYDLLAKILVLLKRDNEIIPRFEKYLAADPKNRPLLYALAERYNLTGQQLKAQGIFNLLLAEQSDTKDFPELFPRLLKERKTEEMLQLLAKVFGRVKQFDAVTPQIKQIGANPEYADEVLDLGLKMISNNPPTLDPEEGFSVLVSIAIDGRKYEKLANLYRWLIKRSPNPMGYRQLIVVLTEIKKLDEAEARWNEMVEKFPDERSSRNLGILAEIQAKAGKVDLALATIRLAMKMEPGDTELLRTLVNLMIQAGKDDDAVGAVRAAIKIEPNNPELPFMLGSVLRQVKRNDEAIALFKGLIDRFPNEDQIVRFAHSNLSSIYTDLNDFARAEAELETILAKDPDGALINNDLGYLYADQGKNLDKAEAMIRKAVGEDPENFAFLDSLGWVLFKRGKFQEARVPLEKAQGDPRLDATIPDHLGDVYFQLQEHSKAKAAWERALRIANETKPVDKRLGEIQKKLNSLEQFVPSPKPKTGDKP